MRTNIEIDDDLLKEAGFALGRHTKKATVDAALRLAVRLAKQSELLTLPDEGDPFWPGYDPEEGESIASEWDAENGRSGHR